MSILSSWQFPIACLVSFIFGGLFLYWLAGATGSVAELDIEDLARELYTAYCAKVGWRAWNGDRLPQWHEFIHDPNKQLQAEAWRAAARRVYALRFGEDMDDSFHFTKENAK